jgi:hypothetical protein
MRSRSDRAIVVSSSQEEGGACGVWLRVRILNSLVFSLSTTVRATRDSLRDAAHVCSASLRIVGSVSMSSTSCSKVSSADMDCVGPLGITSLLSVFLARIFVEASPELVCFRRCGRLLIAALIYIFPALVCAYILVFKTIPPNTTGRLRNSA